MNVLLGEWGLYPWFEEHGLELIHHDDLGSMQELMPYGRLFEVIDIYGAYVILQYAGQEYRVKPDLFKHVPAPPLSFGETVQVQKSGGVIPAAICDIMWHFQKSEPYYYLLINGKRATKRYWRKDFLDINK